MSTRKVMIHEARLAMVVLTVALLACCLGTVSASRRCGGGLKPHTGSGDPCIPADSTSVLALEDGVGDIPLRPPRRKLQAGVYAGSAVGLILLIAAIVGCICCCIHGCCKSQVIVTQQVAAPQPAGSHQQNLVIQMPPNGTEMGSLQQNPVYVHHQQGHHHHHPYAPADANVAVAGYPAAAEAAHGGPQQASYNPPAGYPPQQQSNYTRKIV